MLKAFVRRSREINLRFTPWMFRAAKYQRDLDALIAKTISDTRAQVVMDVGAGLNCSYEKLLPADRRSRFIGVDIARGEMDGNTLLDDRIYTDACRSLGVPDQSVDVIVSKSTVKHLPDNEAFLRNVYAALKPGGRAVLSFLASSHHSL